MTPPSSPAGRAQARELVLARGVERLRAPWKTSTAPRNRCNTRGASEWNSGRAIPSPTSELGNRSRSAGPGDEAPTFEAEPQRGEVVEDGHRRDHRAERQQQREQWHGDQARSEAREAVSPARGDGALKDRAGTGLFRPLARRQLPAEPLEAFDDRRAVADAGACGLRLAAVSEHLGQSPVGL